MRAADWNAKTKLNYRMLGVILPIPVSGAKSLVP